MSRFRCFLNKLICVLISVSMIITFQAGALLSTAFADNGQQEELSLSDCRIEACYAWLIDDDALTYSNVCITVIPKQESGFASTAIAPSRYRFSKWLDRDGNMIGTDPDHGPSSPGYYSVEIGAVEGKGLTGTAIAPFTLKDYRDLSSYNYYLAEANWDGSSSLRFQDLRINLQYFDYAANKSAPARTLGPDAYQFDAWLNSDFSLLGNDSQKGPSKAGRYYVRITGVEAKGFTGSALLAVELADTKNDVDMCSSEVWSDYMGGCVSFDSLNITWMSKNGTCYPVEKDKYSFIAWYKDWDEEPYGVNPDNGPSEPGLYWVEFKSKDIDPQYKGHWKVSFHILDPHNLSNWCGFTFCDLMTDGDTAISYQQVTARPVREIYGGSGYLKQDFLPEGAYEFSGWADLINYRFVEVEGDELNGPREPGTHWAKVTAVPGSGYYGSTYIPFTIHTVKDLSLYSSAEHISLPKTGKPVSASDLSVTLRLKSWCSPDNEPILAPADQYEFAGWYRLDGGSLSLFSSDPNAGPSEPGGYYARYRAKENSSYYGETDVYFEIEKTDISSLAASWDAAGIPVADGSWSIWDGDYTLAEGIDYVVKRLTGWFATVADMIYGVVYDDARGTVYSVAYDTRDENVSKYVYAHVYKADDGSLALASITSNGYSKAVYQEVFSGDKSPVWSGAYVTIKGLGIYRGRTNQVVSTGQDAVRCLHLERAVHFEFSDDGKTAEYEQTCTTCNYKMNEGPADVTSAVIQPATVEANGVTEYTATVVIGSRTYDATTTRSDVPKLPGAGGSGGGGSAGGGGGTTVPSNPNKPADPEAPEQPENPGGNDMPAEPESPAAVVVDRVTYTVDKATGTAKVAVSPKATSATIKSAVTVNGKTYKVTTLTAAATEGCSKLRSLTIAKGISKVSKGALANCPKLTSLSIGLDVISVPSKALAKCPKLKTVKIWSGKLTKKQLANLLKGSKVTTIRLAGKDAKVKAASYVRWAKSVRSGIRVMGA